MSDLMRIETRRLVIDRHLTFPKHTKEDGPRYIFTGVPESVMDLAGVEEWLGSRFSAITYDLDDPAACIVIEDKYWGQVGYDWQNPLFVKLPKSVSAEKPVDMSQFSAFRSDGWPLCPACLCDSLFPVAYPGPVVCATPEETRKAFQRQLETGVQCRVCKWTSREHPEHVPVPESFGQLINVARREYKYDPETADKVRGNLMPMTPDPELLDVARSHSAEVLRHGAKVLRSFADLCVSQAEVIASLPLGSPEEMAMWTLIQKVMKGMKKEE